LTPSVLILSHAGDRHADAVARHLDDAGVMTVRLDTGDIGRSDIPVEMWVSRGSVHGTIHGCDLAEVVGAWHRRPSQFTISDPVDLAELRAGVGGVLAWLPYLNHPADMALAGLKAYQLVTAVRCRLAVPDTMISTGRATAESFAAVRERVVVKAMSRDVAGLVSEDDRSGWGRAAHLTQQLITAAWHARLTVVDDAVFAARIDSPHLDWRTNLDRCAYAVVDVPPDEVTNVRELMHRLRLRFAAIDFVVDDHDRWWFLEANPNGQWLWIEHATGLPIAAAVARALCTAPGGERRRPRPSIVGPTLSRER
jgi:hypothetical protein